MADTLAPVVTEEERAAAAAFDALIGEDAPAPPQKTAPAEPVKTEPVAQERDYEAEARAMGWKPAEEWTGDPSKHRDAKTFVELADNDPAVLRQKYTEAQKQNEDFQRRIVAATNAEIERAKTAALQKYESEITALRQERDRLIVQYAGDPNAIRTINNNYEAELASKPSPQWVAEQQEAISGWERAYAFHSDDEFKAAAIAAADKFKDLPPKQQIAKVDERLAKRFPEYYSTPAPTVPTIPDNGAPPANARTIEGARMVQPKQEKGFDSLPSEAKAIFKMLQNDGVKRSKEDFAKDYYNG